MRSSAPEMGLIKVNGLNLEESVHVGYSGSSRIV